MKKNQLLAEAFIFLCVVIIAGAATLIARFDVEIYQNLKKRKEREDKK